MFHREVDLLEEIYFAHRGSKLVHYQDHLASKDRLALGIILNLAILLCIYGNYGGLNRHFIDNIPKIVCLCVTFIEKYMVKSQNWSDITICHAQSWHWEAMVFC